MEDSRLTPRLRKKKSSSSGLRKDHLFRKREGAGVEPEKRRPDGPAPPARARALDKDGAQPLDHRKAPRNAGQPSGKRAVYHRLDRVGQDGIGPRAPQLAMDGEERPRILQRIVAGACHLDVARLASEGHDLPARLVIKARREREHLHAPGVQVGDQAAPEIDQISGLAPDNRHRSCHLPPCPLRRDRLSPEP